MTSVINKRQQARNERTLQELIKTIPGNDQCADCGARNPGLYSKFLQRSALKLMLYRMGKLERKSSAKHP